MSNWSVVMVVWPSIDYAAEAEGHTTRLNNILANCDNLYGHYRDLTQSDFIYIPPCGDDKAPGSACEVVFVTHWNHFSPNDILSGMRKLRWEYPEQTGVIWKDEDMDQYRSKYLSIDPYLHFLR